MLFYLFIFRFVIYNIEHNHGVRSMIFYDEIVIPECDSRHSLSLYFLRYPNLIRHHTIVSSQALPVRFPAPNSRLLDPLDRCLSDFKLQ